MQVAHNPHLYYTIISLIYAKCFPEKSEQYLVPIWNMKEIFWPPFSFQEMLWNSYHLFTQIWNKEISSVPVPSKKSKQHYVDNCSKAGFWEAKSLFPVGVWPFRANYNRITHYNKTLKQSNRNQCSLSFVKSELVYVWNRTQVICEGSEGRRLRHVKRAEDGHVKEYYLGCFKYTWTKFLKPF